MAAVTAVTMPDCALLGRYRAATGNYTDCYGIEIDDSVSLRAFVFAFYTTGIFKLERLILSLLARLPSTDDDARDLADGAATGFAAWTVEDRAENQLLMCDLRGRTRSWFMVVPRRSAAGSATLLMFGSAVVARAGVGADDGRIASRFRILLGFHKLYSRILLRAAKRRLTRLSKSI